MVSPPSSGALNEQADRAFPISFPAHTAADVLLDHQGDVLHCRGCHHCYQQVTLGTMGGSSMGSIDRLFGDVY